MTGCCAVGCSNRSEKGVKVYKIPNGKNSQERRKLWLARIQRVDFKPSNSYLCEVHFEPTEFEKNIPGKLKQNAVPSLFSHRPLPKRSKSPKKNDEPVPLNYINLDHFYFSSKSAPVNNETSGTSFSGTLDNEHASTIKISADQDDSSSEEIIELKRNLEYVQKKLEKEQKEKENLKKKIHKLFNEDQLMFLESDFNTVSAWSEKTVKKALQLYFTCGSSGYEMLLSHGFPLPSARTLRRKIQGISFNNGITPEVMEMLSLKAISVLEAQRSQAILDLDLLNELEEEALAEPIAFVERLQRNEKIDVPGPQKIYPVPEIEWSKYSLSNASTAFGRRQLTRLSTKTTHDIFKSNIKLKINRPNDKPHKMNQYWTAEEQKRLEELLIQFPPEETESRRWEKIANCLENRTPIQVASRVQKYFIKLMKAGIPVPGRMPSMTYLKKPRRSVIRAQPSTFLVSHTLPVYMPDGEDDMYNYYTHQSTDENSMESRAEVSDDEEITSELRDTPEFKELMLLKKVKRDKLQTFGFTQCTGFRCCRCKVDPIVGIQWQCSDCKPPASIVLCDDCVESGYESGQHTVNHKFENIMEKDSSQLDTDYTQFLGTSDYNYLDPNYLPAT